MTKKKRDDLQIWRSIAIFGVLFFHIWPKWFPNGYVGVDIFFVISGFLMSMILQSSTLATASVYNFYFQRIKRIVPIYLFVLVAVIFITSSVLLKNDLQKAFTEMKWSSLFLTNVHDYIEKVDYFEMNSSEKFFRHCWSLSVEIQFYLIVPLIFYLIKKVKVKFSKIFILLLIGIISFFYQYYWNQNPNIYESTIARIWQFSVGMIAQNYKIKFKTCKFSICSLLLFFVILVEFIPIQLTRTLLSLFCVTISAILTSAEYDFKFLDKTINILVKIGDVSYVMYLIHWPIITYKRYFMITGQELSFFDGTILASSIILLSIICHHIFEKPMLKHVTDKSSIISFLFICYLLIFVGLPNYFSSFNQQKYSTKTLKFYNSFVDFFNPTIKPKNWTIKNDMEFAELIIENHCQIINYNCTNNNENDLYQKQNNFYYCENIYETGNFTAIVIGNSHALCFASAAFFNPIFKHVVMLSATGCQFPTNKECDNLMENMIKAIEKIKPDITYFINHYYHTYTYYPVNGSVELDPGFQYWNKTFGRMAKASKAVIVSLKALTPQFLPVAEFMKRRKNGPVVLDIKNEVRKMNDKSKPVFKDFNKNNPILERFSALKFQNLYLLDVLRPYCGENVCHTIDPDTGLPLFRDGSHVTIVGLKRLFPFVYELTNRALSEQLIS